MATYVYMHVYANSPIYEAIVLQPLINGQNEFLKLLCYICTVDYLYFACSSW